MLALFVYVLRGCDLDDSIRKMTFEAAVTLAFDDERRKELNSVERMALDDRLAGFAWTIGRALDATHNTDPLKCRGARPRHGTPNRRSYTYKVRKAVGYNYP